MPLPTVPRSAAALLLLGVVLRFASCGGDPVNADDSQGRTMRVDRDHHLVVEVDGERFEARGLPSGPVLMLGLREVQVRIGGPLVGLPPGPTAGPASGPGEAASLGPAKDLVLVLLANDVIPGAYPLRTSAVSVRAVGEPAGHAKIEFPGSARFGALTSCSGEITLREVEGYDDGQRFRLERVLGSVAGVFTGRDAAEHDVRVEFTYVR